MTGRMLFRAARFLVLFPLFRASRLLPEKTAYALAPRLGDLYGRIDTGRDRVRSNLALGLGLPPESPEVGDLVRGFYAHLFKTYWEMVWLRRWDREELLSRVDGVGGEHLTAALEKGRGAVLVSGHMGNWEVAAATIAQNGFPVAVVSRPPGRIPFWAELEETRRRHGITTVDARDPLGCLRALREGKVLVLLIDGRAGRTSRVCVPFFERPAFCPAGPAHLALKARTPVLFGAAWRTTNGAFRCEVRPELPTLRTGDFEQEVWLNSALFQREYEAAVQLCPEQQWFWRGERWRVRPGQEGPHYTEWAQKLNQMLSDPNAAPVV